MIEVKNVKKSYSKELCIGPFDLCIPNGSITSLIGPNGAGKSTLLLMIGRLLKMDDGNISVSNLDVFNSSSNELSKVLSILKQENHFITRLTVRQLVGFGRFPYSNGRLTKDDENIISKYINFFELDDIQNKFLDELSGGQRQRAYVAMVLCQETEYILLDEPLNNLDISKSVKMMQYLKKACKEFNKTIVLVIHDINFAARYSDNICAIKDGNIVAFDKTENIMNSELLSEIFDTKIDIIDSKNGPVAVF